MTKTALVIMTSSVVVVADQLSKWVIRSTLLPGDSIPILACCLQIVHARNPGGAFSFLAGAQASFRAVFFLIASVAAIAILIQMLRTTPVERRLLLFALAGILGGAIGNLIDRARLGHVTDFIDVCWDDYHWPAFNVADSFITVGLCILLAHMLLGRRSDRRES